MDIHQETSNSDDFTRYTLGFFTDRKIVTKIHFGDLVSEVGWVYDKTRMQSGTIAIGIFEDNKTFVQFALADSHGRIYGTGAMDADLVKLEPVVILASEGEGFVHHERFYRKASQHNSSLRNATDSIARMPVEHGAVVARNDAGRLRWMASWMSTRMPGKKNVEVYTFEQVSSREVSREDLAGLEYPDAMVMAYYVIFLHPRYLTDREMIGFGSSHIYRRLRAQAPLSAIRTSVDDTRKMSKAGMNTSGVEEYFSALMEEAGALERIDQLEAKHGLENLELTSDSVSNLYSLRSRSGVDFESALKTMRIESNLNRFLLVSSVIENNYHYDFQPTEDFVSLPYIAHLSSQLLENPAFDSLNTLSTTGVPTHTLKPFLAFSSEDNDRNTRDTSFASPWLGQFYDVAYRNNRLQLDDITRINAVYPMLRASEETARHIYENTFGDDSSDMTDVDFAQLHNPYREGVGGRQSARGARGSEWVYRHALASLIRHLRLPLRNDVDFRSNLAGGDVAVQLTTLGSWIMPQRRYNPQTLSWEDTTAAERSSMSTRYSLRVGIMLAALAFGADEHVKRVSLHIKRLATEQDLESRDPAQFMRLLDLLSNLGIEPQQAGVSPAGSRHKSDPKDGDIHGVPGVATPSPSGSASVPLMGTGSVEGSKNHEQSEPSEESHQSLDEQTFLDLIKSVDFSQSHVDAFLHGDDSGVGTQATDGQSAQALSSEPSDEQVDAVFDANYLSSGRNDEQTPVRVMSGPDSDPLALVQNTALAHSVISVTFTRDEFISMLAQWGLGDPVRFYRQFQAIMHVDAEGGLEEVEAHFDLRDAQFSPPGAQEEPELSSMVLDDEARSILGVHNIQDLSIQRTDVLERALSDIEDIRRNDSLSLAQKAHEISAYIDMVNDPELNDFKDDMLRSVIDRDEFTRPEFTMAQDIDNDRTHARELFMSGNPQEAFAYIEERVAMYDNAFKKLTNVPLYFNSYAERVVYNQLFANEGERVTLIPDNLFYAHMELVEVYGHMGDVDSALRHLNQVVAYAPVYPIAHLRLAIILAERDDWQSSYAAASNALRVSLDKEDAAYSYYRMAYAAWMQDHFDLAAACYIMSIDISESTVPNAMSELTELQSRARSQDIMLPDDREEAITVLEFNDVAVWPFTPVTSLMMDSARAAVDNCAFVAARTLAVSAARMTDRISSSPDSSVHVQFLRSLNA